MVEYSAEVAVWGLWGVFVAGLPIGCGVSKVW
jgi:hypothetical protein